MGPLVWITGDPCTANNFGRSPPCNSSPPQTRRECQPAFAIARLTPTAIIAPLKDFTIDAIAYVYSKAKGKPPAGLRCPRCHCGDRSVTEGEMYRPAPDPHHHLKAAILALDIDPALKDAPVSTPMRACNLSTLRPH
jgi:hypothetical protein